jgi:hypothetical protein
MFSNSNAYIMNENNLHKTDLRNISLSLYRERRKHLPTLPESREDTHAAIEMIDTMTSKNEQFVIGNVQESGIIIFSTELLYFLQKLTSQSLYPDA